MNITNTAPEQCNLVEAFFADNGGFIRLASFTEDVKGDDLLHQPIDP